MIEQPSKDVSRWAPILPLRFIHRDGERILQQAWAENRPSIGDCGKYVETGRYEFRDVPLMHDGPAKAVDWWKPAAASPPDPAL